MPWFVEKSKISVYRAPACWIQRRVVLRGVAGPTARDSKSVDTILYAVNQWRRQLQALTDMGWKPSRSNNALDRMLNCVPTGIKLPLKPWFCSHTRFCPFCYARWVASTWHDFKQTLAAHPRSILWVFCKDGSIDPKQLSDYEDRQDGFSRLMDAVFRTRAARLRKMRGVLRGVYNTMLSPCRDNQIRVTTSVAMLVNGAFSPPKWFMESPSLVWCRMRSHPRRDDLTSWFPRTFLYPSDLLQADPEQLLEVFRAIGYGFVEGPRGLAPLGGKRRRMSASFGAEKTHSRAYG